MQLWQSCASAQTPLAQLVPSGLQPGTQVLLEPQTEPLGQVSLLGKQSTQVPSGKHRPLVHSGFAHCGAPPAPPVPPLPPALAPPVPPPPVPPPPVPPPLVPPPPEL